MYKNPRMSQLHVFYRKCIVQAISEIVGVIITPTDWTHLDFKSTEVMAANKAFVLFCTALKLFLIKVYLLTLVDLHSGADKTS